MKGVTDDDKRDAAAGWTLSSRSSRRAGTKRRRVIKSGADDMLELEGAEEDENEDGDLLGRERHPSLPRHCPGSPWRRQRWCSPEVDCQAMGIDTAKSPDHPSPVFPFLHSIRWQRLLRPAH